MRVSPGRAASPRSVSGKASCSILRGEVLEQSNWTGRSSTHSSTSSLPSPNFVSSPLRQNVYKIKSSALRSTRATQAIPDVTEFHNKHLPALPKTNHSLH